MRHVLEEKNAQLEMRVLLTATSRSNETRSRPNELEINCRFYKQKIHIFFFPYLLAPREKFFSIGHESAYFFFCLCKLSSVN